MCHGEVRECKCQPEDEKSFEIGEPDLLSGTPFVNADRHENAAGKKLCGMCRYRAAEKGFWRCSGVPIPGKHGGVYFHTCPAPNGKCYGWHSKPSTPRPPPPKKEGLPVDTETKFIYIGRPPGGVVTVAYAIAEKSHIVEIAFSFCSPKDRWCKAIGRSLANERLGDRYLTIPYLYSPSRVVREVAEAAIKHDWEVLFCMANYAQSDLRPFKRSIPGWTKNLAKRMEADERRMRILMMTLGRGRASKPTAPKIMARILTDIFRMTGL